MTTQQPTKRQGASSQGDYPGYTARSAGKGEIQPCDSFTGAHEVPVSGEAGPFLH